MPAEEIRKYVEIANAQKADMVVLTGDFVTFDPNTEKAVVEALSGLRAQGWEGPFVRIEIDKRIPVAAGMGGGSADAAAAMRMVTQIAAAISIAAFLYFLRQDQIVLFGDAVAHMNIARRVIDSRTPGPLQLGTVWLPLPHLLMLPFVAFRWLWQPGIGGSFPSMLAYVLGTLGVAYHLANGLHGFAMGWGLTASRAALKKSERLALVFFVVLLAMSWGAIYGLYRAGA